MRPDPTDDELMERAAFHDDEPAFQELVQRVRPQVTRFLNRLGCGIVEAEDLAQETLIRLWVHRARYSPTRPLQPYLLEIAKNAYLSHCARGNGRVTTFAPQATSDLDRWLLRAGWQVEGPEATVIGRYREHRLSQAVALLPPGERLVFVLKHHEGLKYADIGELLGIAEGTVKSRMFRAVRALRRALPDLDPDATEEES